LNRDTTADKEVMLNNQSLPTNIILLTKLFGIIFVYKSILSILLYPQGKYSLLAYALASSLFIVVLFVLTLIVNHFIIKGSKLVLFILTILILWDTINIIIYLAGVPHLSYVQIFSLPYYIFTSWAFYLLISNRSFFFK